MTILRWVFLAALKIPSIVYKWIGKTLNITLPGALLITFLKNDTMWWLGLVWPIFSENDDSHNNANTPCLPT